MRAVEFIIESLQQTTLAQLYNGNYPDRDETFWDYVSPSEFNTPLTIQTLQRHKVMITLLGQYRAEHIDEITDMLDDEQQEMVQAYVNDPALSSKVIVLAGDIIIDGNHRALAAAIKGVPINYVDLADLEDSHDDQQLMKEDEPVRIKLNNNDAAKAWIEKVYAEYPQTWQNNHIMVMGGTGDDQQFAMFELVPSMSKKDAVEVKWFQAYPLRQGVGSRAMQQLQTLAREDGIALTLYPWDKGQVSQAKLTKFYKGQGFKPTVKGAKNMMWTPETVAEGDKMSSINLDRSLANTPPVWKKFISSLPPQLAREFVDERPVPDQEDIDWFTPLRLTNPQPVVVRVADLLRHPENQGSIGRSPDDVIDAVNQQWRLKIPSGKKYDPNPARYRAYAQMIPDTASPSVAVDGVIIFGAGRFVAAALRGDETMRVWSMTRKQGMAENFLDEGLRVDVPNEEWLQDAIDYAKQKSPDRNGLPYMGKTTATVRSVDVPVDILKRIPGMRREQQNVRQADLAAIIKIMSDTGKLPLGGHTGEEYKPFINVAYDGSAWINEGNHRIMAAAKLGWKTLPVEISYFDGGERVKDGAMYPGRIGLGDPQLDEAFDQPYKTKSEKSEHGDIDMLAKLPDGSNLSIMFNQEYGDEGEEVTQVEFYRNNSQAVTGEGDSQRIFATVLDAIQKYIKKYKPQRLSFSAIKAVDMDADDNGAQFNPESRAKLYDRLVQRYSKALGYRAFRADNSDIVIYELSRLKSTYV